MPEIATKADIEDVKHLVERQSLALTIRLAGLMIVGVGVLGVLQFFH